MGPGTILVAALAFGVIVLISKSIRVVQQAQTMIIERLGKYHKTLGSGINFVLPVIDRPRSVDWHQTIITPAGDSYSRRFRTERIDLRETVYVFPRQNVITKDNVVVEIDALIYSQITDPVRATYEIANLPDAIEKLTQTTLRNVIGEMELDHILSSRDTINAKLRAILEEAARIKVAEAEAQAIERITAAIKGTGGDPARYLIAIRYIETLKEMVSGQGNKVVYMPYEATGVLGSLGGIREMLLGGGAPEKKG